MKERHNLAGQIILVKSGHFKDEEYKVEDWWENVGGKSWMFCDGNPACLEYAVRSVADNLPTDNEVVYGKIRGLGYLLHTSEIGVVK